MSINLACSWGKARAAHWMLGDAQNTHSGVYRRRACAHSGRRGRFSGITPTVTRTTARNAAHNPWAVLSDVFARWFYTNYGLSPCYCLHYQRRRHRHLRAIPSLLSRRKRRLSITISITVKCETVSRVAISIPIRGIDIAIDRYPNIGAILLWKQKHLFL